MTTSSSARTELCKECFCRLESLCEASKREKDVAALLLFCFPKKVFEDVPCIVFYEKQDKKK